MQTRQKLTEFYKKNAIQNRWSSDSVEEIQLAMEKSLQESKASKIPSLIANFGFLLSNLLHYRELPLRFGDLELRSLENLESMFARRRSISPQSSKHISMAFVLVCVFSAVLKLSNSRRTSKIANRSSNTSTVLFSAAKLSAM